MKALPFEDKLGFVHEIAEALMFGLNLLVYGYGSKYEILNMTAKHLAS